MILSLIQNNLMDLLTIESSTEFPAFTAILLSILLAFVLSSMIAYTYEKTTPDILLPTEYLQTIILLGIISATVMQAIGDSLARGLGMMGALSMVRFRTTFRAPRNMIFIFASLAAGISVGVYGHLIAITGTFGFCIAAFILKMSQRSRNSMIGILKLEVPVESNQKAAVEKIISKYSYKFIFIKSKTVVEKKKKEQIIIMNGNNTQNPVSINELPSKKENKPLVSEAKNGAYLNGVDKLDVITTKEQIHESSELLEKEALTMADVMQEMLKEDSLTGNDKDSTGNTDMTPVNTDVTNTVIPEEPEEILMRSYEYHIVMHDLEQDRDLELTLQELPGVRNIKLNFMDVPENA